MEETLNVGSRGNIIPVAGILKRVLLVFLRVAEEEIGVVVYAHDIGPARAAAIRGFATMNQPKIVSLTQSIETHGGIAAGRGWDLKILLQAGGAGSEAFEGVHAPAVGRELRPAGR